MKGLAQEDSHRMDNEKSDDDYKPGGG